QDRPGAGGATGQRRLTAACQRPAARQAEEDSGLTRRVSNAGRQEEAMIALTFSPSNRKSAEGQSRRFRDVRVMSGSTPTSDIGLLARHGGEGPDSDISAAP